MVGKAQCTAEEKKDQSQIEWAWDDTEGANRYGHVSPIELCFVLALSIL